MKLSELKPSPGSTKEIKRKGRGIGSGHGKTAGRGHKGQNARAGRGIRPGFEGGQMPLFRRLPKRGFTNVLRKEYAEVNVSKLDIFENNTVVTPEMLRSLQIIKKIKDGVVVLGKGELSKKLVVRASKFSKAAVTKIEAAGGKVEVV